MLQRERAGAGGVIGHAAEKTDFFAGREGGEVGEEDEAGGEGAGAHGSLGWGGGEGGIVRTVS